MARLIVCRPAGRRGRHRASLGTPFHVTLIATDAARWRWAGIQRAYVRL